MKKYLKHNLLGIFSLILSAISFTVYAVFALFINWIVAFIIIISSFVNITLKNVSFSYGDEAARTFDGKTVTHDEILNSI